MRESMSVVIRRRGRFHLARARRAASVADQSEQESRGDALHAERHAKRRKGREANVQACIEIAEARHHPPRDRDRRNQKANGEEAAAGKAEAVDGEDAVHALEAFARRAEALP